MEKVEVTEAFIYCLLSDVLKMLEQKTFRNNKRFLNLCVAILAIGFESKDEDTYQNLTKKIFKILEEQGIYKGL